jgi:hypothetical protein
MELKRIDNLWHFFATQNDLFLKKEVHQQVKYQFDRKSIRFTHLLNPKFPLQSQLIVCHQDFDLGVDRYMVSKMRFGLKKLPKQSFQQQFFPNDLLKLSNTFNLHIERDRQKRYKVILEPFVPKNMGEIRKALNQITRSLWGYPYFSELIKN